MAQTTNYNLPYPSDYTEQADVPEAIKDLAEAVDTALGGKADSSDLSTNYYTKSQTYSKTEIDNMIGDIDTALDLINGEVV